ncbi:MAG: translation initiation factor [Muribaculaceae bacterium]|nr:translation initiation factor [Muribaculaceae bacterium]MDE5967837.1 translation initiation factor [Muribaculaceae bacterium]
MADWQSSLQQFLDANPDLPQGDDAPASQPQKPQPLPRLDIIFERKGRAGKQATIIAGFPDSTPDNEIEDVARRLKQLLGTGGSARGGEILIQGDRRADVERHLRSMGYQTRRCN